MTAYVVDTNVPITANGGASQASLQCQIRCVDRLVEIVRNGTVVIDDGWRILREYGRCLRQSGQPGVGDRFYKHVLVNKENPAKCEQVVITALAGNSLDFQEFPRDRGLTRFDPDDRKFVAVAKASALNPKIQVAIERGYHRFHEALRQNGVRIDFLCLEMMVRRR